MDYRTLASKGSVVKTIAALKEHGVEALLVETSADALAKLKELIPAGASVTNGASVTLEQIGYIEYLKSGTHGWNNLKAGIVAEKDPTKQAALRKQASLSDFYLGSVNALSETGEFINASNTGSQLPNIVFNSPNLIFVASTMKIVPTLAEAMKRVEEYVLPLENQHMMDLYKVNSVISKMVIFKRENPRMGRKVRMILVNEKLGY